MENDKPDLKLQTNEAENKQLKKELKKLFQSKLRPMYNLSCF